MAEDMFVSFEQPAMAKQSLNGVLQHLRKVAAVQTYRQLSDSDLLERFIGHDDSAFTVLIERHGPMVLGVCRRALHNHQDAEDACQAALLVLARKATSLRKRTSLSSWLHGVACRVAARLKRDHARRSGRERAVDAATPKDPAAEVTWREVQAILDDELQRLPERYRTPLVLCYLECLTRDEAAEQLGLSSGILHGRLQRGRDLLRERLCKRGIALSAALSAAALWEGIAQAALPPTMVVASTRAALLVATGQPVTSSIVATHVLALTQEVLKNMFYTKLKLGTAALVCICLFAGISYTYFPAASAAQETLFPPAEALVVSPPKGESDLDFIRRISKDLRGVDPTPAEVHFFVTSKNADKRQELIDLFIKERHAKKDAAKYRSATLTGLALLGLRVRTVRNLADREASGLEALQQEFFKELHAAREKGDVAKITQAHLDRLVEFVKTDPKSEDLPGAMRQIITIYESQGKTVEAGAWRDKLRKEHPKTSGVVIDEDDLRNLELSDLEELMGLEAITGKRQSDR